MKFYFVFIFLLPLARGEILYETDFDSFPVGDNQWAGNDGWLSGDTSTGAQAIESNLLPALLNVATLGFAKPTLPVTVVARTINYDHVSSDAPIVQIDTLLGVEDSTNNRRDVFYLSIYNSSGDRLASVRFDNTLTHFGLWRDDGVLSFDTFIDFIPGELSNLVATIDLENNTWTVDADGIPVFEDAQFSASGETIDFGSLVFEWHLSNIPAMILDKTARYGDNYLLVADVIVQSLVQAPALEVTSSFGSSGAASLSWTTVDGWSDQVEYSTDLITWLSDLPDSNFTAPGTVNFTDTSGNNGPVRFYRVRRTQAP